MIVCEKCKSAKLYLARQKQNDPSTYDIGVYCSDCGHQQTNEDALRILREV